MFDRILIAYDGSPEAESALNTGLDLAATLHADTTLVTVLEPLPGYVNLAGSIAPELPVQMQHQRRERLEVLQALAQQKAAERNLPLQTLLLQDNEVSGILDTARTAKANLLVIGMPRHTAAVEWAGTFRHIANESPCPILAVSCHPKAED